MDIVRALMTVGGGLAGKTAVNFDGSTYVERTAALVGRADSKMLTCSFWFKRASAGISTYQALCYSENYQHSVHFTLNNGFSFYGSKNSGGGNSFYFKISDGSFTDTDWHHIAMSVDVSNSSKRHVYVDGVDASPTWQDWNNTAIDLTSNPVYFGVRPELDEHYKGDLAEFYMAFGEYIDLSIASNLAKFLNGTKPADLGADGSYPTGSRPIIYMSGDSTSFQDNLGGGGAFTVDGTLSDSSSKPSLS